MARTHIEKHQLRFPINSKNRDLLYSKLVDFDTTLDAIVVGSAGVLSADTTGRAFMAANYFNLATMQAKFDTNSVDEAKFSRAKTPQALSGAGAITLTESTTLFTSTGAGNALTVADGSFPGQRKTIIHVVKGSSGTGVITQTTGAKLTSGITTITLSTVFASITLEWDGSVWNCVNSSLATIA
jgi:hypothetical protein